MVSKKTKTLMGEQIRETPSTECGTGQALPSSGRSPTPKKSATADKQQMLDFGTLVVAIRQVHEQCAAEAGRAVNISLTLRNWLIGLHIATYELGGADRARYGENLFSELAEQLAWHNISNCNRRQLYDYVKFYRTYPQIVRTVSAHLQPLLPAGILTEMEKEPTVSAQLTLRPQELINNLSYSKFKLLVDLDEELKRSFYEIECIRGNWSVRELKRQIDSLYYERSGLSKNKEKLAEMVRKKAETASPSLTIRDPYVFEFLGLKSREVMSESDLEDALLDRLQDFLLELGYGFCFEARQKRILIGKTHGFVDLVFYHRILKCHVLVELKVDEFSHQHLGQINTYVAWYRKNMMAEGDNPPVGILLCTEKDHLLVEYALAGIDNKLFVSKYQLELPKKEEIRKFLEAELIASGQGK